MKNQSSSQPSFLPALRIFIVTIMFLVLGVIGFRVLKGMRKKPKKKVVTARKIVLYPQGKHKKMQPHQLVGYGRVNPGRQVTLTSEVSGRVTFVSPNFREGGRVKKKEILLKIDPTTYWLEVKRLKSQIASLRKQYKIASQASTKNYALLRKNKQLYRRKVIDHGSLEQKQIAHLDRSQRLEALAQNISQLSFQLRNARILLNKTIIRAPFHGRINKRLLERGDFAGKGARLVEIASIHPLEIPVDFSLQELDKITGQDGKTVDIEHLVHHFQKTQPVQITRSGSNIRWLGRVSRIGSSIQQKTHTIRLWVRVQPSKTLDKSPPKTLLPGTFCHVVIPFTVVPVEKKGERS